MSKNTIIGIILIALLFVWSMYSANKQQDAARARAMETAKAMADEKAKHDSLAAIKNEALPAQQALPAVPQAPVLGLPETAPAELAPVPSPSSPQNAADVSPFETEKPELVAVNKERTVFVETDNLSMLLSSKGAKIVSIKPKTLADSSGSFPELLQNKEAGALSVSFDKADFSAVEFSLPETLPDTIVVKDSSKIVFYWQDEFGRAVSRSYTFFKSGHSVRHLTRIKGFVPRLYSINWKGGMRETEYISTNKSFGGSYYLFSEVILNNTYNVERETVSKQTWFNRNQGKALWFGLRRKYIAGIINFDGESEAALGAEPISDKTNSNDPGTYALTVSDNMVSDSIAFDFTILPLQWKEIESMNQGYEKIIVSGWEWMGADKWFVWLCGILLQFLNAFYSIIPNYGIAIILLTILVKLVTTPLAVKQMRSTRSMMALKPELDAIRAKHRSDMRAQQQEIMALYAKHGISPFSGFAGCLPMLLQMPVFIGLFVVLGRSIELREAPFFAWISDLSKTDVVWSGISIPYIMPEGLAILPFIMVVTTWLQTKQTITDPNQKMMVWMMPGMMFFFSAVMPSGLVLYWTVSNLWSIAQYAIIKKPQGKIVDAKIVETKPQKKKK